jgi:uncharacterized protein YchJ
VLRFAACATAFALLAAGCTRPYSAGAATPTELLTAYIDALEHRDEAAIRRLVPSDHEAEDAIRAKIATLAHPVIYHVDVELRFSLESPDAATAILEGRFTDEHGREQLFHDDESLAQIAGRWYLILGTIRTH